MPLPDTPPTLVQAPKWAGVGLRIPPREADPSWPADWWQRDLDMDRADPDAPDPPPFTLRMLVIPPPP